MKKLVSLFTTEGTDWESLDKDLTARGITNYRVIDVADDYEEHIRQEIFYTAKEGSITFWGALAGAAAGALLTAYLLSNNSFGQLLSPLLANTIYSALFTGAGVGLAAGGLIGGLYALSRPLPQNFSGGKMAVVYCEPERMREAIDVFNKYGGIFI